MTGTKAENAKLWDWILKIMVPLSITYFGWSTAKAYELDKRVAVIEENRYTPSDHLEFERKMNDRFETFYSDVGELKSEVRVIKEILLRLERSTKQ